MVLMFFYVLVSVSRFFFRHFLFGGRMERTRRCRGLTCNTKNEKRRLLIWCSATDYTNLMTCGGGRSARTKNHFLLGAVVRIW